MRPTGQTGTLGKAMAVVDAIASAETPLRFGEIAERVAQPRGTVHRQLSNLVEEGLVEALPDHRYALGLRLLKLAARSWNGSQFRTVAEPHLRALHQATGETVHLGVLQGVEVIYLDKVESRQAVRMHSQIGKASPCYCTGVGKAALSVLTPDDLEARLASIRFVAHTAQTLMTPDMLKQAVARVRQTGIAFDAEEHESGIHCIAAPVSTGDGSIAAGISVTAPVYRVDRAMLESWSPLLIEAASAITEDLTLRLGPRA